MRLPHADRFDLVGRRWLWYAISLVVIVPGTIAWATAGLNKGIDFTGGAVLKYEAAEPIVRPGQRGTGDLVSVSARIRRIVEQQRIEKYRVTVDRDGRLIFIRATAAQSDEQAEERLHTLGAALKEEFGTELTATRDIVGPVIGRELGLSAIKALILGLVLILIYVSWRYEFRFAVAAVVAMGHDLLLLVGVFALTQREIDSSFVPVLLTVVGYSINDTIVIFDRIRENMRLFRAEPFDRVVNGSLWQTMTRSINTGMCALFTLIALYFLGGPTITNFCFGLILGISVGTYSSIFVASPIVVSWRAFSDRRRAAAMGLAPRGAPPPGSRRRPSAPAAAAGPSVAEAGAGRGTPAASQAGGASGGQPTAPETGRTRKRKKKSERTRRRRF